MFRIRGRGYVRVLGLALVAMVGIACAESSPVGPTSRARLIVPDTLAPAVDLIDADESPLALLGRPTGTWLRAAVRGVVIDSDLPREVRAQCCDRNRLIRWSAGWLPDPTSRHEARIAAGIIVHEARHAEGYRHTCPDGRRDRTFDEGGAWAVQILWLRHMGDDATADAIAAREIGCE